MIKIIFYQFQTKILELNICETWLLATLSIQNMDRQQPMTTHNCRITPGNW